MSDPNRGDGDVSRAELRDASQRMAMADAEDTAPPRAAAETDELFAAEGRSTSRSRMGTPGIGTGASAIDPVELERARAGLPSRDDEQGTAPLGPIDRAALSTRGDLAAADEVTPNEAHRERLGR